MLYLPGSGGAVFASRQAYGLSYQLQHQSPEDWRARETLSSARGASSSTISPLSKTRTSPPTSSTVVSIRMLKSMSVEYKRRETALVPLLAAVPAIAALAVYGIIQAPDTAGYLA